jgi:hypothetical protein
MITYASLLGMLGLAGALAFGLGGREVAARMWSQAYDKSQKAKVQASRTCRLARAALSRRFKAHDATARKGLRA